MVLSSVEIEIRFAQYIGELRDLFAIRHIPWGAAEDLDGLVQRLEASDPLRREMGSLIRAIVLREQENVSSTELLEMIVSASAGHNGSAAAYPGEIAWLRAFVSDQARSPLRGAGSLFPARANKVAEERPRVEEVEPVIQPAMNPLTVAQENTPPAEIAEGPLLHRGPVELPIELDQSDPAPSWTPLPIQQIPSAAQRMEIHSTAPMESSGLSSPEADLPVSRHGLFARVRSIWREPDLSAGPGEEQEGEYPQYGTGGGFSTPRTMYWAAGVLILVLGVAAGFYLQGRPKPPAQASNPFAQTAELTGNAESPLGPDTVTAPPDPAVAGSEATTESKPSPYGPILGTATPGPDTAASAAGRPVTAKDWDLAFGTPRTKIDSRPIAPPPDPRLRPEPASPLTQPDGSTPPNGSAPLKGSAPLTLSRTELAGHGLSPHIPGRAQPPAVTPIDPERLRGGRAGSAQLGSVRQDVYISASGAMATNLVSAPAPDYPPAASAAGVQGEVVVQAVVGLGGEVVGTRVISGPEQLRNAAQDAVRRWRYKPLLVAGRPSMTTTDAILEFRLER